MNNEEFLKTVANRVQEGVIEILKEYRVAGKTLDDVIKAFEELTPKN